MPTSIPVDVLREILEHVDKKDLPALCRVNKIFCSCSQDVLYRKLYGDERVVQTLAQSTDLARRVRWFTTSWKCPGLAMALRNISSLRILELGYYDYDDLSILDGCTFKLDSFKTSLPYSESLQQFLISQPSITHVVFYRNYEPLLLLDKRCLPNLTRVGAHPSWLSILIPGRPVKEVRMRSASGIDLSLFTLSTTSIQKLRIPYDGLYPKPVSLLVSIFPSLVHLMVTAYKADWTVRVP
jgi:F-box domain